MKPKRPKTMSKFSLILLIAVALLSFGNIEGNAQAQMTISAPYPSACNNSVIKIRLTSYSGLTWPVDNIQKREFISGVWGAWSNIPTSIVYDGISYYWNVTLAAKTEYRSKEAVSGGTLYSNIVSVENQYKPRLLLYGQDQGGTSNTHVATQGTSIDFSINPAGASNVTVTWYKNNVQVPNNPLNGIPNTHQYNYYGSVNETWKAYVYNNQTPGACGSYTNEIIIQPNTHISIGTSSNTILSPGETTTINVSSHYGVSWNQMILEKSEYSNGTWGAWVNSNAAIQYNGNPYFNFTSTKRTKYRAYVPVSGGRVESGILEFNIYNAIATYTPITANSSESSIITLPVDNVNKSVTYFDGLGRPMQSVNWQGSPLKKDIVQPLVYDGFGREYRQYLPAVASTNNGWYKQSAITDVLNFYNNGSADKITDDTKPYAETIFEASPLNRVLEQGAPGVAWQPDATDTYAAPVDRSIKKAYEFNTTNEVLLWTYTYPTATYPMGLVNAGTASSPVYYGSNQLFKNKTKDEHRNEIIEFTDKQGRTVLKKVQVGASQYANTYYIYDDFGQLVCVIPPEAVSKLATEFYQAGATDNTKDSFLSRWAFRYRYDGKRRMILKHVPGADSVRMVYDNRDRLVMTQDGNQRTDAAGNITKKEWTYTKYDALNRPIMTGIYIHGSVIDRAAMSALISTSIFHETYNGVSATHGYSNTAGYFPSSGTTLLTATYYDNYNFKTMVSGLNYVNNDYTGQPAAELLTTLGLVTGTKVNILGTANYLYGVTYFDNKYRVLQTINQNHKAGTDRATSKYDFQGRVLETKRTYVVSGVTRSVKETFTYDHAGRLLTLKHSANGAAEVMIVKNEYNELGELVDKNLHGTNTDNYTTFKQSVDYRYNIRGWLAKINESDVSTLASGETLGDYFGMELGYNGSVAGITSNTAFNGNISAVKWSTGVVGAANLQGNAYNYDPLNRLSTSSHYKDGLSGWTSDNSYLETGFNYDLNGNILGLTRKGDLATTIDNLTYSYTGNQLNYVNDSGDATKGFINGNTGTDDFAYDVNGNLIKDKNKGINNNNDIKYNYLNLPIEVIKGSDKVKYYYDATGRKLYQELYTGATVTKTTDYLGELIFENNALQFINHSEGRVLPDGANWEYQYHLKDHLGNVRLTFTAKTPTAIIHTATFESAMQSTEQATFNNYSSITYDLVDKTDAGTVYQKVQSLNGGASGRVGLAKSYSVMPGDKVKAEVYAKYRNLTTTGNATSFINALASAFGTSSSATGELGKIYAGLNSFASTVGGGDHYGDNESAPKAFVTIILFDKNYNLVDAAWDQIDAAANQTSGTIKTPPVHDYMFKEVTVSEPGYAYVFLSNEHPTYVDIYYDEFKTTHTPSPIVGVNDYYPFGLTFNSYQRENSIKNKNLYNGGSEVQDQLNLGWYQTPNRMYVPEIGRFLGIDKLSDLFPSITPMIYGFNNPIKFFDPLGLAGTDTTYVGPNGGMLDEVVITASRINNINSTIINDWTYSTSPIDRALAAGYRRGGYKEVYRLWNQNRTIHAGGMYIQSEWSKDFNRVWGTALNVGVTGTILLAVGSPMLIEIMMSSAPTTAGERATAASLEFTSQVLSGTSIGDVDWLDVGASGAFGFNTFGSVLTSSNINLTINNGLTSDFGTSTGAINMASGFVSAGINEGFIDKQVQSATSKIALKLGADWIIKIETNQINKSVGGND